MLICTLSSLLASRALKITKVSKDTGISRTTLTALAMGHAKGVQYDTLNALCMYLKVSPERILAFWPADLAYELSLKDRGEEDKGNLRTGTGLYDLSISFASNGKTERIPMKVIVTVHMELDRGIHGEDDKVCRVATDLDFEFADGLEEEMRTLYTGKMCSVPEDFLYAFRRDMEEEIKEEFPEIAYSDYHVVNWPFDSFGG